MQIFSRAFTILGKKVLISQFTSKSFNAFSIILNKKRCFSDDSKKDFISFKSLNGKSDEDEILEIYDLPLEDNFGEDPTFEYISQNSRERVYEFISPNRSVSGVFDLKEMVQFLKVENFNDVVTIRLPESARYGEFMVIASARSKRQLSTTAAILQKLYKMKRRSTDVMPPFEGLKEKSDWIAVDLGNIILHLFASTSCRSTYDLESLWSTGPEFDEQTHGLGENLLKDTKNMSSFSDVDWEAIVSEVQAERQQLQITTDRNRKPD